jgi:hypothetical protein
MFTTNRYVRRTDNPTGKMRRVPAAGVRRFSEQVHRGYRYQIGRRVLGVTVKRATYSVAISHPEGGHAAFLSDLADFQAARQAAEKWIDAQTPAPRESQIKAWEPLLTRGRKLGTPPANPRPSGRG